MRSVIAVIVGVVGGIAVQSGVEMLANVLYPIRVSNAWDPQQMGAALAARPTNALLIVAAGYFLGALTGGAAGKAIAGATWTAWVPGLVLAAMVALLAYGFPLPGWAIAVTLVAPLLGALFANHLIATRYPADLAEDDAESEEPAA